MDLADVHKPAKNVNDVKYLKVLRDLFDRTVDAKGMETKDSKETVSAFLTMTPKKNWPNKNWIDKGAEFKKLSKTGGM